jgi:ABC-type lipoprotein release transport system permease subunit
MFRNYKLIFKLAWLNVWRRKARAVLVVLMIGVSMSVMLGIQGLYDGMTNHMIESTLRSDSGEVSIYAPSHRLHQSLKYHIKETPSIIQKLSQIETITAIAQRVKVTGLVSTARKSSMAKLIGIDKRQEQRFGDFEKFIMDGKWNTQKNYALIGKKLAKTMKLSVGSRVIFSSQNLEGDLSSISLRIKGIVQTTNPAIDDMALFVSLSQAQEFAGLSVDDSTQIALRIDPQANLTKTKEKITTLLPNEDIYTWLELYPALEQMQEMMKVFNGISFFIVMLVVLIGIMGVMLVSILERLREFGILLAIGEPYKNMRLQVVIEALILGLGGYIIGAVLGAAVLYYMKSYGLDLSAFSDGLEEFGMASTIYATIKSSYFSTTFIAIIIAALLSVILPIHRLKKLNPIEVIQGD